MRFPFITIPLEHATEKDQENQEGSELSGIWHFVVWDEDVYLLSKKTWFSERKPRIIEH